MSKRYTQEDIERAAKYLSTLTGLSFDECLKQTRVAAQQLEEQWRIEDTILNSPALMQELGIDPMGHDFPSSDTSIN